MSFRKFSKVARWLFGLGVALLLSFATTTALSRVMDHLDSAFPQRDAGYVLTQLVHDFLQESESLLTPLAVACIIVAIVSRGLVRR